MHWPCWLSSVDSLGLVFFRSSPYDLAVFTVFISCSGNRSHSLFRIECKHFIIMKRLDIRVWICWCWAGVTVGRIQQIQLLGRGMKGPEHDKLWNQLEAEIHLHRHKTVVRACRGRVSHHCQLPAPQAHVSHTHKIETKLVYCVTVTAWVGNNIIELPSVLSDMELWLWSQGLSKRVQPNGDDAVSLRIKSDYAHYHKWGKSVLFTYCTRKSN